MRAHQWFTASAAAGEAQDLFDVRCMRVLCTFYVLFIDDEAAIRKVTTKGLVRLNYRVLTAADGLAQAFDADHKIGAVVTDMHMPNMDGLMMVRSLRSHHRNRPILVTSGRMDDSVAAEFVELGITETLAKPFTGKLLSVALEKLLSLKKV
jgi:CheY-like chemotaxis protein